jgi:hypothetical protein
MQYLWRQQSPSPSPSPPPPLQPSADADAATADADATDTCAVCLEIPGKVNVSVTACGHTFCTTCLLKSLKTKNTCPCCRTAIEPARESIDPITVSIASDLIREEERAMDLNRRISIIQSFGGTNGRVSMIFSLCREIAFSTAHAIARWQKTTHETYDNAWTQFDYDESDDGSDSD